MGCTSSSPNMDGYSSLTGNSSTNKDTGINTSAKDSNNARKEIESVLPSCDNLENNLQLASQNSVINETSALEASQETVEEITRSKTINTSPNKMFNVDTDKGRIVYNDVGHNNYNQCDENFTTLREVVERVILDHASENLNQTSDVESTDNDNGFEIKEEEKNFEEITSQQNIITKSLQNEEEHEKENMEPNEEEDMLTEEATSPSQSECSRATRWEALADIAAELPPSLAVDPLTGQIYSLANK